MCYLLRPLPVFATTVVDICSFHARANKSCNQKWWRAPTCDDSNGVLLQPCQSLLQPTRFFATSIMAEQRPAATVMVFCCNRRQFLLRLDKIFVTSILDGRASGRRSWGNLCELQLEILDGRASNSRPGPSPEILDGRRSLLHSFWMAELVAVSFDRFVFLP